MAEFTLAGLTLTEEDWGALDEDSRALLVEALTPHDGPADDAYHAYQVFIEEVQRRLLR